MLHSYVCYVCTQKKKDGCRREGRSEGREEERGEGVSE